MSKGEEGCGKRNGEKEGHPLYLKTLCCGIERTKHLPVERPTGKMVSQKTARFQVRQKDEKNLPRKVMIYDCLPWTRISRGLQ